MNNHSANSYEATERRKMQKVKLGEICEITMGQSPESQYYNVLAQGLPFFQGNADFGDRHPVVRVWCTNPKKTSDVGAILMSVRAPIGALNLVNVKCAIGRGLVSIKPNSRCMLKYLWYALKSKVDVLKSMGTGSTFKAISKPIVEELEIPLPPIEEQRAIAERLDKVSQLVDKRKEQLQQLDQLVKSQFIDMFGDVEDKKWTCLSMNNLMKIVDGDRGKNYPKQEDFSNNGYCLFLNAKNVTNNGFNFNECLFITKSKDESMRKGKVQRGDLILTTRGTIGNIAVYDNSVMYENVRINSGMVILKLDKSLLNENYFINVFKKLLVKIKMEIANGSAQPQLPISLMQKILIPVPPMELQKQFAEFVERVDKLKEKVNNSLTQLNLLKQSLMQQYFN